MRQVREMPGHKHATRLAVQSDDSHSQKMEHLLDALVSRTSQVLNIVRARLPAGFPMHVADPILNGLQQAADKLAG